jgi:ABC-2 type transport system permease protein
VFLIGAVTLLMPLLTMNLIADERRRGTWELLSTAPIAIVELLLGKLVAAWLQFAMCLAPWPVCLVVLRYWNGGTRWLWNSIPWFDGPGVDFDSGPIMASIVALALIGLTFSSLGLCASSISRRPLAAAMLSGCSLVLLFLLSLLPRFLQHWQFSPTAVALAEAISVWGHLDQFSRGLVSPTILTGHLSAASLLFVLAVSLCRRQNV